jgi:beta-lactamase superfamily II metal-dependent hydrolase
MAHDSIMDLLEVRMHRITRFVYSVVFLFYSSLVWGQANGKLQIHFMDVGQGDGAVLISPKGEVVLFDDGVLKNCDKPLSYLQQLGITKVDYHIASHYHADHIGCTAEVLQEFPLQKDAFDRGESYPGVTFQRYVSAVGTHRKTATAGMTVRLDSGSPTPVNIVIVALNGNGVQTSNENDLSVVSVVHFGQFDAEIGGDLSGVAADNYEDIETSVAQTVGQVEVYKVHHHGSRYSTNSAWLSVTKPMVAIISTGNGNGYGHPTKECLDRLHTTEAKIYWTEAGNGAQPDPERDVVGGNIVVEVAPDAENFTVTHSGSVVDTFPFWGASPELKPSAVSFAWSKRSKVYHYSNCRYVANISPDNLQRGDSVPQGKTLHKDCPKP